MNKLCVIIAIFPHGDADTVCVAGTKEQAVADWRDYMLNGERDDTITAKEREWLDVNAALLAGVGRTERQDSGVFYRLNPMIVKRV